MAAPTRPGASRDAARHVLLSSESGRAVIPPSLVHCSPGTTAWWPPSQSGEGHVRTEQVTGGTQGNEWGCSGRGAGRNGWTDLLERKRHLERVWAFPCREETRCRNGQRGAVRRIALRESRRISLTPLTCAAPSRAHSAAILVLAVHLHSTPSAEPRRRSCLQCFRYLADPYAGNGKKRCILLELASVDWISRPCRQQLKGRTHDVP